MRRQAALIAFVALTGPMVLTMAGSAVAQTYKADDIVKHFQPDVGPKPAAGVTRGLCIGTEAECAKAGHAVEGRAVLRTDAAAVADAERRYAERYKPPRANPRRVVIEIAVGRVLGSV